MTTNHSPFSTRAQLFMITSTSLLLVASLAGLAACQPSRAESEAAHVPPAPAQAAAGRRTRAPIPVTLAPVTNAPVETDLTLMGRVTHTRDLKPSFKTGGLVAAVLVEEGQRVEPGQVLARLDTAELDAGLAQANAALGKAQRDLGRVQTLERDRVLPGATREDAETARAVAAAQVRALRFNRETATLTATHAGVVLKRLAEPGEVAAPGQPILVIGVEGPTPRVEIGLPARQRARAALGDLAEVRLDGDERSHPARVVDLAPTLSPGTDRVAVTVELLDPPSSPSPPASSHDSPRPTPLPRGLVATVTFAARPTPTLPAIPLSALVEGEGRRASVWVLGTSAATNDPSTVSRRDILIDSIRPDGLVLVSSGLEGIEAVVDAGQAWLYPDAKVSVTASSALLAPSSEHAR